MRRRYRNLLRVLVAICCILLVLVAATIAVLRANWFQNKLREAAIASIKRIAGNNIELGSFSYDWTTLTLTVNHLVLRGTEAPSNPPLFQAKSVQVRWKLVSLLGRNFDLARLIVNRPSVYLQVGAGGSTNMVLDGGARELLNLRIGHLELNNAAIQVNERRTFLNARCENAHMLLTYNPSDQNYNVNLESPQLQLTSPRIPPVSAQINLQAALARDQLSIKHLNLSSQDARVTAAGAIRNFSQPILDLTLDGYYVNRTPAVSERSPYALVRNITGAWSLRGTAHYDRNAGFSFTGNLGGRDLTLHSGTATIPASSLTAEILASNQQIQFNRLTATALGANFAGRAVLSDSQQLRAEGSFNISNVHDLVSVLSKTHIPWNCKATGHAAISGTLSSRDWTVQAALQLAPLPRRTPVLGTAQFTWRQKGNVLDFQPSRIQLPNSDLAFSGNPAATLAISLDTRDLTDLSPVLPRTLLLPALARDGNLRFDGALMSVLLHPRIQGRLELSNAEFHGETISQLRCSLDLSPGAANLSSLSLDSGHFHAQGSASIGLTNWMFNPENPVDIQTQLTGLELTRLSSAPVQGLASATVNIAGSLEDPHGLAKIRIENVTAYGEHLNNIQADAVLLGNRIHISHGKLQAGQAQLVFFGNYTRDPHSWQSGQLDVRADSSGFPIATLGPVRALHPALNAQLEVHAEASLHVAPRSVQPKFANGTLILRSISLDRAPYGNLTINAATAGDLLRTNLSGDLRGTRIQGAADIQLSGQNLAHGNLHLGRANLLTLEQLWPGNKPAVPSVNGFIQADLDFSGPAQHPRQMHAGLQVTQLQINSPLFVLHNPKPILVNLANGSAIVKQFEIAGPDTTLKVSGALGYDDCTPMNLHLDGSVNLAVLQLLDPGVQTSGRAQIATSITGRFPDLSLTGALQIRNASLVPNDIPTSLTAVNGSIQFTQNRATIQTLTGQYGGGKVALTGFAAVNQGHLTYNLTTNAENVRLRYASSASVTASAQLHLVGAAENSLLSGAVSVSRVVLNPNTDIGNLLAALPTPSATPTNQKSFLSGLQFDIHLESAPNLQVSSALSRDVEADIDLRLRGKLSDPVLLGSVSANQGDIRVFGNKYSINRCEVDFSNPVRIEPVLDLSLQTQTRGITVDITIAGTPGKLNINYRSDPPLQPHDIIALLTVGRAPGSASTATASNLLTTQLINPVNTAQPNAILGQAISPSSGRLSKLFGITNIRIDPLVQGITNAAQARLTLEQQISRQITVTYVTNLSETAEQIFRFEWAFSPHYSLVALRDDNGEFGLDIQYRKQFK